MKHFVVALTYIITCWVVTFVIKGTVKVVAARIEAGGELYEVASPGVAGSWETGERHQVLSASRKEVSVHAAIIWEHRVNKTN